MDVSDKATMYAMLSAGKFGNTARQFFDVAEWREHALASSPRTWGVRTLTPGGPCRLHCPSDDVPATCDEFYRLGYNYNISEMIDSYCTVTLWCEVYRSEDGLVAYGIERPQRGESWRKRMPVDGRHWYELAADHLLRRHLNENSFDDVRELLDEYDGHVVEFSATAEHVGVLAGRNHVIWEVRNY